jgi:hypothetical protein
MNQPIDLSSLLTLPGTGRGRGRGAARGRGRSQSPVPSHGHRGSTQPDFPPGFPPEGAEASHRDKRPRLEEAAGGSLTTLPAPTPVWAPRFSHGNRAITVRDSVESEGTAMALSQAFLLPGDMQKEVASSPDNLLGSFMSHSAKVICPFVSNTRFYPSLIALLISPRSVSGYAENGGYGPEVGPFRAPTC